MRAILLIGLLLGAAASAQEEEGVWDDLEPRRAAKYEVSLLGGIGGFTGELSALTDVGPVFGVQVDAELLAPLRAELAYSSFVFPITDTRFIDQSIWGHGASASAKLSLPYSRSVSPFVAVGLGATWADPTAEAESAYESDLLIEVPASLGIEFKTDFLEAGIRGTWRGLLRQELADDELLGQPGGGVLSATLSLGVRL